MFKVIYVYIIYTERECGEPEKWNIHVFPHIIFINFLIVLSSTAGYPSSYSILKKDRLTSIPDIRSIPIFNSLPEVVNKTF